MNIFEIKKRSGLNIKECPFCETSTENLMLYGYDPNSPLSEAYIECHHCGATGPHIRLSQIDTDMNWLVAIVKAWNKS